MRILIFATEITPYFENSYRSLIADGHILQVFCTNSDRAKNRFPPHSKSENLQFLAMSDLRVGNALRQCKDFQPDLVIVPALLNLKFIYISLLVSGKKVLISDTFWHGTLKQKIICALGRNVLSRIFDFAFVPGSRQVDFMYRLGFRKGSVFTGLYAVPLGRITPDSILGKERSLLFIGRLANEKNILNTVAGYLDYRNRVQNPYVLKIAGIGGFFDSLKNLPGVILLGYVNNQNLPELFQHSDALVLMSTFEPWGVVISEATANARPVICSAACGSSTDLVINGINGYVLEIPTISEISSVFEKFHNLSPAELLSMAEHSISIAGNFGKNDWVYTIRRIERLIT